MWKRPPKSLKNEMFIFGLCLTSDDWPSNLSDKHWPKCEKGPLSHWKMKCLFLDYIQFLMISWAIWVMNVNQNVKKAPKLSTNEMVVSLAGGILLVINRAPVYCIRLVLVLFISSVDVLMILLTILISFLVFLFIFSFGSFFLFFLGCDLVSSHSIRYSSFSCS